MEFVVTVEATLNKDKLFDPSLEPTLDDGDAGSLFDTIDEIEDDTDTCSYCDVTVQKCGLFW